MNFPTLPTDNLYKFIALLGIVIILFSFYLPFQSAKKSQELLREVDSVMKVIDLMPQKERVKAYETTYKKLEELKFILEKDKPFYLSVYVVGGTIGIILTISGFRMWYKRVQKYQDKILENQANELLKEKEKNKNPS